MTLKTWETLTKNISEAREWDNSSTIEQHDFLMSTMPYNYNNIFSTIILEVILKSNITYKIVNDLAYITNRYLLSIKDYINLSILFGFDLDTFFTNPLSIVIKDNHIKDCYIYDNKILQTTEYYQNQIRPKLVKENINILLEIHKCNNIYELSKKIIFKEIINE